MDIKNYHIDLIKMTKDEIVNLSEFVSENTDHEFSIPWKITAIISQAVDFLKENKNKESVK